MQNYRKELLHKRANEDDTSLFLTLLQTASYLYVSRPTLDKYIKAGKLDKYSLGPKYWCLKEDVENLLVELEA